jgi:tripartite-type tricarboxylate transporter receptor subunit TctC
MAPTGTPRAIVDRLNKEIIEWAHEKEVAERLVKDGSESNRMSPEQFGQMIAEETEMWRKVIQPLNLKLE